MFDLIQFWSYQSNLKQWMKRLKREYYIANIEKQGISNQPLVHSILSMWTCTVLLQESVQIHDLIIVSLSIRFGQG